MKRRWRLRRALADAAKLMLPGAYRLEGDTAQYVAQPTALFRRFHPAWARLDMPSAEWVKHDVAILRDDCLILLSVDRLYVTRLYLDANRAERVVHNSAWLKRAFPCPLAESVDLGLNNWYAVREEFVDGCLLRDAEPRHWRPAYSAFLSACRANATRCEGFLEPSLWFKELDQWNIGGRAGEMLAYWRGALVKILNGAPLLWSHGDAHNGNLLVNDTGKLGVIDVERAERQPFFFDALSIPRGSSSVNVSIRRDYLAGIFDRELGEVWRAANVGYRPEWRVAYLVAVVIAQAFRPQFIERPAHKRREKLVSAMEKIMSDCEEQGQS